MKTAAAPAVLHMLCGKIASGKSTLAAQLAADPGTVLVAEDPWLAALYPDALHELQDCVLYSRRLRAAITPHVVALLDAGVSVVLDFAANTPGQRRWLNEIVAQSGAAHRLHLLEVPDAICLDRLRRRNAAAEHPFAVTEALYHEVTGHFAPPTADEGFTIVRHTEAADAGTASDRPAAPHS